MTQTRLRGAVSIAGVLVLLSGCASSASPAETATAEAAAAPAVSATSPCSDLNPLGFVESRDLVDSFAAELGAVYEAETVVKRCEEFPNETIDAAVRAVLGQATSDAGGDDSSVDGAPLISYAWTDEDGYTFDLVIESSTVAAVTDIANAKPGEALVDVTVTTSGDITNTTPGRNATVRQNINFAPVWGPGSTACRYLKPVAGAADGEWCTLRSSDQTPRALFVSGSPLREGESTALGNRQTYPFKVTVAEADAEAFAAEMESPAGFLLGLGSMQTQSECLMRDTAVPIAASTVEVVC